jgi:hypothetical protein
VLMTYSDAEYAARARALFSAGACPLGPAALGEPGMSAVYGSGTTLRASTAVRTSRARPRTWAPVGATSGAGKFGPAQRVLARHASAPYYGMKFQNTTQIPAASGGKSGPHPARDPV